MKFAWILSLSALLAPRAHADNEVLEARQHTEKGLAAYGLGHFEEAAAEYEKAFSMKPDSALLYDAAQAHRLAHHNERALQLYKSYLRLFENVPNRDEVERKINALEQTIANEKAAAPSTARVVTPMSTEPTVSTNGRSRSERAKRRGIVIGAICGGFC
jgi:tetratricopeptide (TPR) repeat protein